MHSVILGITILTGLCFYFLPTIIAVIRSTKHPATIFSVNLLFGWTVVGWIAIAIWVLAEQSSRDGERASSLPVGTDTWSFDPSKLSDRSVEQSDEWVLGRNFAKSPQKIS